MKNASRHLSSYVIPVLWVMNGAAYGFQGTDVDEPTEVDFGQHLTRIDGISKGKGWGLTDEQTSILGSIPGEIDSDAVFWSAQTPLPGSCHLVEKPSILQVHAQSGIQTFELLCEGFRVDGAGLRLNFWNNRLTSAKLRTIDADPLTMALDSSEDRLANEDLLAVSGASEQSVVAETLWRFVGEEWQLVTIIHQKLEDGSQELWTVDARSGELLLKSPAGFHVRGRGLLYEKNDHELSRSWRDLPQLRGTTFLDGEIVEVFAPNELADRVSSSHFEYAIDPGDRIAFDQVQTYFNITRGLEWMQSTLGFNPAIQKIVVRVNALIGGRDPNNAEYLPGIEHAEIHLGSGSSEINNLGRDSDVAFHELAHHLIYQFINTRTVAAALALHEGFADYFTYAINGDPYLAETVLPGQPYLRTALLDKQQRFDNPYIRPTSHNRGEIWSSVLWQARQEVGPFFDKIVYHSLAYLDAESDFEDAIMALFHADRDLQPRGQGDGEFGLFGTAKCSILQAAVDRGFGDMVKNVDGETCGIDTSSLPTIEFIEADVGKKSAPSVANFGCGTIRQNVKAADQLTFHWMIWLTLFFPVLVGLISRRAKKTPRHTAAAFVA